MSEKTCPCGSEKTYTNCCKLAHKQHQSVQSAEALMRSRYSAFALGLGTYLQQSHALSTRPSEDEGKATEQWAKSVVWVKLNIHNTTLGTHTVTEGTVEFTAYFIENGKMNTIHENSYFEKIDGKWYYVGYA